MQTRQLLLTGLLLSTPALAFPPLQDREAPSKEIKELVEKARAQAELLRDQVDASGERMEVKHFSLTSRATASSGTDRGYLGIEPTFEGGVMVVGRVMPGSGADKAGLRAGDRILSVNKIKFDQEGAEEKLTSLKAGKKVTVQYKREGEDGWRNLRTKVTLSPLSALDQGGDERVEVNRLRRIVDLAEEGDRERQLHIRMDRSHEEDGEEHGLHDMLLLEDGENGVWVVEDKEGPPNRQRRARVKVFSGESDGRPMKRQLGADLEGLPDHIRELIEEHGSDIGEGELRVIEQRFGGDLRVDIEVEHDRRDRNDGHDDHDRHDGHDDHDDRNGHNDRNGHDDHDDRNDHNDHNDRNDRNDRNGHDGHDGHNDRNGHNGRNGHDDHNDRNGHDHDHHDGHDDRNDRDRHDDHNDRNGHDHHGGHETRGKAIIKMLTGDGERTMEFDFDGADLRDMGGRVRQLMGGRSFDLEDVLARVRGDRNDRSRIDSRGLHREEHHDGAGDRDSRGQRGEQARGMNRPQAFGRGRGMGMMRGRGRGGPEMFREEYGDDGEFAELEERIEELEHRIGELEELLERARRRRNR